MGQRLALEVDFENETLANAYFHWSAYTRSALDLLLKIAKYAEAHKDINPRQLAVMALMETGALPNESDREEVARILDQDIEDVNVAVSRNDGLLGVSQDSINDTKRYAEGIATLIINDDGTFCGDMDMFGTYENFEEVLEVMDLEEDDEEVEDYKDLQVYPHGDDLSMESVEDIENLVNFLDELVGVHHTSIFQLADGTIMEIIE